MGSVAARNPKPKAGPRNPKPKAGQAREAPRIEVLLSIWAFNTSEGLRFRVQLWTLSP